MILYGHVRRTSQALSEVTAKMLHKLRPAGKIILSQLPLRLPLIRLSEVADGATHARASDLVFGYQGEALRINGLGQRRSKYRSLYRIIGGRSSSVPITAKWQPADACRFEIHGQSVAAYGAGDRKIAELEIDSNVPSRISLAEDLDGRPNPVVSLFGPAVDARLSVRHSQFVLVERKAGRVETGWKSWQNILHLNYWLDAPQTTRGENHLTVVFSSLSGEYDFTYNYRSALEGADSYRLFLLDDFGSRGSYYFADHRDTTIYNEVQLFLSKIVQQLGIPLDRVIFAGSSKGGTGALLHGIGMGVGKIIVGAPQIYPGSYLKSSAPNVLEFIAGGRDDAARRWLDDAVASRVSRPPAGTSVRILVGAKDHHLKRHIEPLLKVTNFPVYDVKATIIQDLDHGNIGTVYRHYIKNIVDRKPSQQTDYVLPHRIRPRAGAGGQLEVKLWKPKGELIACHLYHGSQLVEKRGYSKQTRFIFSVDPGNTIRFRIYRRRPGEARPFAQFYSASTKV